MNQKRALTSGNITELMNRKERFERDLSYGEESERELLKLIKTIDPSAYLTTGYNPDYDLVSPLWDMTIELKDERRQAPESGNVYIEIRYKDSKQLSGLSTSKATHWAFRITDELIKVIEVNELKELVKEAYNKNGFTPGGDKEKRTEGVLVRHSKILAKDFEF